MLTALYTERIRRTQLRTIRAERAGASSELAQKVVHEVNNPLSIIKNYLRILGTKLSEQNIAQEEIRILNEEIDRVALMLQQLTAFSEKKASKTEPVDINALLSDLLRITKDSLWKQSKIIINEGLDTSLPALTADGPVSNPTWRTDDRSYAG